MIVPNRKQPVGPMFSAYSNYSVEAGQPMEFHAHSTVPHRLSVVRIGWDAVSTITDIHSTPEGVQYDPTPLRARDWIVHESPILPAQPQTITPGSYIHVFIPLDAATPLSALTLEAWVRPSVDARAGGYPPVAGAKGVITQYTFSSACGFGLFLGQDGRPFYYFGNGGSFVAAWLRSGPTALTANQWHHMAAVFANGTGTLYVDGQPVDSYPNFAPQVVPGPAPLRLGAYGDGPDTTNFFDGDLAMPVIYGAALTGTTLKARAAQTPPVAPTGASVLACWPLSEEHGVIVQDSSPHDRNGVIVNRGTWMVGGPGFAGNALSLDPGHDPDVDPKRTAFTAAYDPSTDPARGHAIRLASDDLYDCAWPVTYTCTIPHDCPPGLYVARFVQLNGGLPVAGTTYDMTFVVRRASSKPAAPVLVLCATNTWLAYSNFLSYSSYAPHLNGQPTYHRGVRVPWPVASPYGVDYGAGADDPEYSHLVRAELFTHVWLEQQGIEYDAISDYDLDQHPDILGSYRTMFIVGHSEYWSARAYQAVATYLDHGGRVIVASGQHDVLAGFVRQRRIDRVPQAAVLDRRVLERALGRTLP
jgi:N,N-dimethylformamidase beta subunit-like protein/concanavalin A-like lectin/glucanase superfamily protein